MDPSTSLTLAKFVQHAWPLIEPGPLLKWNWHIDLVCDALQRQIAGDPEYRNLVICLPPGMGGSLMVSVFAPAWEWLRRRRSKLLLADSDIVRRDVGRCTGVVDTVVYSALAADVKRGANATEWRPGVYIDGAGFNGSILGHCGDDIIIDTPIDPDKFRFATPAAQRKMLDEANDRIEGTLPTRLNHPSSGRTTLLMSRLHPDDPAAHAIAAGWPSVILQMEYDPDFAHNHPDDPRRERGELLFPERFSRECVQERRATAAYAAQYQQAPEVHVAPAETKVRISPALYERIKTRAEVNHRSAQAEVEAMLELVLKPCDPRAWPDGAHVNEQTQSGTPVIGFQAQGLTRAQILQYLLSPTR
jgi:hypothetical protein